MLKYNKIEKNSKLKVLLTLSVLIISLLALAIGCLFGYQSQSPTGGFGAQSVVQAELQKDGASGNAEASSERLHTYTDQTEIAAGNLAGDETLYSENNANGGNKVKSAAAATDNAKKVKTATAETDNESGIMPRADAYNLVTGGSVELAASVDISTIFYNGNPWTPAIVVTYNGTTLTEGTHYTVAYSNNVNAGNATITVTGTGSESGGYYGTITRGFQIRALDFSLGLSVTIVSENVTYTGRECHPAFVFAGTGAGLTFTEGVDYDIAYTNAVNVGRANIFFSGKGNLNGSESFEFNIVPRDISDGGSGTVTKTYTYNGNAHTPAAGDIRITSTTVSTDGTNNYTLVAGTDYVLATNPYSNNINASNTPANPNKATVKVAGIGNFTGTLTVEFTISALSLTAGSIRPQMTSVEYNGKEQTPTIPIIGPKGNLTLAANSSSTTGDYYISNWINNIHVNNHLGDSDYNPGAFAYGINNYSGILDLSSCFEITPAPFADKVTGTVGACSADCCGSKYQTSSNGSHMYTGTAHHPTLTAVNHGIAGNVASTEYSIISYGENINAMVNGAVTPGTILITAVANGDFSGSAMIGFTIGRRVIGGTDFTASTASAPVYNGTHQAPQESMYSYYDSGLARDLIKNGVDVKVQECPENCTNHINAGQYTITLVGCNNYTGTVSYDYVMSAKNIGTDTTYNVAEYTYTGSSIEPHDLPIFNSAKNYDQSSTKLQYGPITNASDEKYDYTVTSWERNVNISGSASNTTWAKATISGHGNYTGTYEVYFRIVAASVNDIDRDPNSEHMYTMTGGCEHDPSGTTVCTFNNCTHRATPSGVYHKITQQVMVEGTDYVISDAMADGYNQTNAGTAYMKLTGKGNYTGSIYLEFTIEQRDIQGVSNYTVGNNGNFTYTGQEHKPSVTNLRDSFNNMSYETVMSMTAGTDYKSEFTYSNNVNTNAYSTALGESHGPQVIIEGIGNYKGTLAIGFTIDPRSIEDIATGGKTVMEHDADATVYTGALVAPSGMVVKYTPNNVTGATQLTLVQHVSDTAPGEYTFVCSNAVNAAAADSENPPTVTITGQYNYFGSVSFTYAIQPKDIATDGSIVLSPTEYTYDGTAKTPSATVGDRILDSGGQPYDVILLEGEDADYTLAYTNNLFAAPATGSNAPTVTVTGHGNYTGTLTGTFTINPKDVTVVVTVPDRAYDGTLNAYINISSDIEIQGLLPADEGYVSVTGVTAEFADKNVGQNKPITIAITFGGGSMGDRSSSYSPDVQATTGNITPKIIDAVTFANTSVTYNGNPQAPTVTIPDSQIFSGDTVTVTKIDVSATEILSGATGVYDVGSYYATVVSISDGNTTCNYELTSDVTKLRTTFVIAPKDISVDGTASYGSDSSFVYDRTEKNLAVNSVTNSAKNHLHDNTTLTRDTDYTVSYENNIFPGVNVAKVIITGKGNYKGTMTRNYSIGRRTITEATIKKLITVYGKTYDGTYRVVTASSINMGVANDDILDADYGYVSISISGEYFETVDAGNTNVVVQVTITGTYAAYYQFGVSEGAPVTNSSVKIAAVINPRALERIEWGPGLSPISFDYDGQPHRPTATPVGLAQRDEGNIVLQLSISGSNLVDGEAVRASSSPYTAVVTAILNKSDNTPNNNYTLSGVGVNCEFYIKQVRLDDTNTSITFEASFVYVDRLHPIVPDITFVYVSPNGNVTLVENTDYKINFEDNDAAGRAWMYITCIDGYSGSFQREFTITPRVITYSGTATALIETKEYDGTLDAKISADGSAPGKFSNVAEVDDVVITPAGTYASKNVGTGISVTVSFTLSGLQGTNYKIDNIITTGAITARKIWVEGTTVDSKVYDANTNAASVTHIGSAANVVKGETVNVSVRTATFDNANAGVQKTVTVVYNMSAGTGTTLSNYTMQNSTHKADITPRPLTANSTAADKTYDGNTTATVTLGTVTGYVSGQSLSITATGVFSDKNVGTKQVTISYGLANNGSTLASNYKMDPKVVSAKINPKSVTATITPANKTYDGTNTVTSFTVSALSGVISGETVTLPANSIEGYFASVNAANGIAVVITKAELSGADCGNYELTYTVANANITQRSITAANGGSLAVNSGNYVYTGSEIRPEFSVSCNRVTLVEGIDFTSVSYTNNINAGTATVTVTGRGNYKDSVSGTFTIAKRDINDNFSYTITSTHIYTGAAQTGVTFTAINNGRTLTSADYTASYANNTDATTQARITLTGKGNYTGTATMYFTIARKQLTGFTWSGSSFAYDGNEHKPTATVTVENGLVSGDAGKVTVVVIYSGTPVAAGTYTAEATGLTGDKANNYQLPDLMLRKFEFIITMNNLGDGTLTVSGIYTYTGEDIIPDYSNIRVVYNGTTLTANTDYQILRVTNNRNAGTATLTVEGKGSYGGTLEQTFTIDPKELTISGSTVKTKSYDGTTEATVTVGTISGIVTADQNNSSRLSVRAQGTFTDKNAGTSKDVSVQYIIEGDQKTNYTMANGGVVTLTGAGTIEKRLLGITTTVTDKEYDGNMNAPYTSGSLTNVVSGEIVTVTTAATFADKNVGENKTVTVRYTLNGTDATTNYSLPDKTFIASITPKKLTAETSVGNKSYDGNTDAPVTVSNVTGFITGESFTVTASGTFATKNVGTNISVTVKYILPDTDVAKNYTMDDKTDLTANITPAVLTANSTVPASKIYDGTTNATVTLGAVTGFASGESFTIEPVGTYASPNVGNGIAVTIHYNLPDDIVARNYTMADKTVTANITQKNITVGGTFTITPRQFFYTGAAHEPEFTVTNLADGEGPLSPANYTVTYSNNVNAGKGTIRVTGTGNYTGYFEGEFDIFKATLNNYTASVSIPYDGAAHSITIDIDGFVNSETYDTAAGRKVYYGLTQESVSTTTANPTATNVADTKTVYYKVEFDNYNTVTGSALLEIKAVQLTSLTWDNLTFPYDGSAHIPTAKVTVLDGLPTGLSEVAVTVTGEQTDAGTYTATATGIANTNFLLPVNGKQNQTYTITKVGLTDNTRNVTAEYDGTNRSLTLEFSYNGTAIDLGALITAGKATVRYGLNEASINEVNAISRKDVGTTTVWYLVTFTNYNDIRYSHTIEITPKTVTLNWSGNSFEYDGTVHTPTATVSGLIATETETVTVTVIGGERNVKLDGGKYTATATGVSSANYKLPTTGNTFEFEITPKVISTGGSLTVNVESIEYDGTNHTPSITVTNVSGNASGSGRTLISDTDYTVTYSETMHAGTVTVTATGKGNYKGTITGTYVITQARLTLDIRDQDIVHEYNGAEYTFDLSAIRSDVSTAMLSGFKGTDTLATAVNALVQYGTSASVMGNTLLGACNVDDSKDIYYKATFRDYVTVEGSVFFSITPKKLSGLDWTHTTDLIYTGVAQKPTAAVKTADLVTADQSKTFTVEVAGAQINANCDKDGNKTTQYIATATKILNGDGSVNTNYALPDVATQEFTIKKATLTDATADVNKVYDGNPYSIEWTFTGWQNNETLAGLLAGGFATAKYHTGNENVFQGTNLTARNVDDSVTAYCIMEFINYETVKVNHRLTITPRDATVDWNGADASGKIVLTYNGYTQAPTATLVPTVANSDGSDSGKGLIAGDIVLVTVDGAERNANAADGTLLTDRNVYQATATDVNSNNYRLVADTTHPLMHDFYINQATLQDTSVGYEAPYDGAPHPIDLSFTGFVGEDTWNSIQTNNEMTIRYKATDGTYSIAIAPTQTNFDTKPVDYQVTFTNYKTVFGSRNINITKRVLTGFEWEGDNFIYSGVWQAPIPKITTAYGLVAGEEDLCAVSVMEYYKVVNGVETLVTETIDAGNYKVIVKSVSNSNYAVPSDSAASREFTIARKMISDDIGITVKNPDTLIYTGEEINPTIVVKNATKDYTHNSYTLAVFDSGTNLGDYTIRFQNNVNAGNNAEIIIEGVGNYQGIYNSARFTIHQKTIADGGATATVEGVYTYNGSAQTPTLRVVDNHSLTLVLGTDFEISGSANNKNAYALASDEPSYDSSKAPTVTVSGKGNYTGSITVNFQIQPKDISDGGWIELDNTVTYTYNGSNITVESGLRFTVTNAADLFSLRKDTDFTVTYVNNLNAATADSENAPTFTVLGMGNYCGEMTQTFTINPQQLDKDIHKIVYTNDSFDYVYDGNPKEPPIKVTNNGTPSGDLIYSNTEGQYTDYAVEYQNNINAGTAFIYVYGRGNYTGTLWSEFTIEMNVTDFEVEFLRDFDTNPIYYDGTAHKPEVTVKKDGVVLTEGVDYTLDYQNNIKAGNSTDNGILVPCVVVNGARGSNYEGTTTQRSFTIEKAPLTKEVNDVSVAYNGRYDGSPHSIIVRLTGLVGEESLLNQNGENFVIYYVRVPSDSTDTPETYNWDSVTNTNPIEVTHVNESGKIFYCIVSDNYQTYKGSQELTVTPIQLTAENLQWSFASTEYNGSVQVPTVSNFLSIISSDYTVLTAGSYSGNLDAKDANVGDATYTVTLTSVTGGFEADGTTVIPNYDYVLPEGGISYSFKITPITLTSITWQEGPFVFNGQEQRPTATCVGVRNGETCNVSGTRVTSVQSGSVVSPVDTGDYRIEAIALDNTNYALPDNAYMQYRISGKGFTDGDGDLLDDFQILLTNMSIENGVYVCDYAGTIIEPNVTISYQGSQLTKDVDFTVFYSANMNAGTASVTILGQGNYLGASYTVNFIIKKAVITAVTWSVESGYTHDERTHQPYITGVTLQQSTIPEDLPVAGDEVTIDTFRNMFEFGGASRVVGTHIATAKLRGNYANNYVFANGVGVSETEVQKSYIIEAGGLTVTVDPYKGVYDGLPHDFLNDATKTVVDRDTLEPASNPEWFYSRVDLPETSSAWISFRNLLQVTDVKDSGIYYLKVTAEGRIPKLLTCEVTITPKNLGNGEEAVAGISVSEIENSVYDGKEKRPTPTVTDALAIMKETDYTFSYENNVNVGTGYVIVAGTDNYEGSFKVPFTIDARQLGIRLGDIIFNNQGLPAGITLTGIVGNDIKFVRDGIEQISGITLTGFADGREIELTDFTINVPKEIRLDTGEVIVVTVKVSGDYENMVRGDYGLEIVVENGNYQLSANSTVFTSPVTIDVASDSFSVWTVVIIVAGIPMVLLPVILIVRRSMKKRKAVARRGRRR